MFKRNKPRENENEMNETKIIKYYFISYKEQNKKKKIIFKPSKNYSNLMNLTLNK